MLKRRTVLHAGVAAIMLVPAAVRACDAVVWKKGDRGVTLQEVPVMSGKTRLGGIPAGIELTAEKVEGRWILVEAPISGEANKRKGWVATELVGRLPSDLPPSSQRTSKAGGQ
jgi:hypothetical protein